MTNFLLFFIDPLAVSKWKIMNNLWKGCLSNLNEKMDMVIHETKSMNPMAIPFHSFMDEERHLAPICIAKKYFLTVISPQHDMVKSSRSVKTHCSCHNYLPSKRKIARVTKIKELFHLQIAELQAWPQSHDPNPRIAGLTPIPDPNPFAELQAWPQSLHLLANSRKSYSTNFQSENVTLSGLPPPPPWESYPPFFAESDA